MNNMKSHFEIHSRFRNGIFLLCIFLFVSLLVYYFNPRSIKSKNNFVELTDFQNQIDSLKKLSISQKKEFHLKPFNPNFISDHKGYQLGLSTKEIDRLHLYRNQNKWINSVADFKKVTRVSDSLLTVISPLFKFPEWVNNNKGVKKYAKKEYAELSYSQKGDLNVMTLEELQGKVNMPDFIANRIIRYRDKIDGFVSDIQLKDVKGLYDNQRNKILSVFTVKTSKKIEKFNINTASVNELIKVPYFDFEMALEIKDFIEDQRGISNFDELGKIKGFSLEKIDRIALYLTVN